LFNPKVVAHYKRQKRLMTTKEKVHAIVNNKNIMNAFVNLYLRWLDERDYEDINEYGKVLFGAVTKEMPMAEVEYVKASKRPFGIRVMMDGREWYICIKTNSFGMLAVK